MLVGEPVPPRPFCTQPRSCRHAHSMSWLCPSLCSTLFANTKPIFKTNFTNYVTTCTQTCMTSTLIISDWRVKSRMVLQVAQLPFKPCGAVYWCFRELTTWCTRQSGIHHAKRPSENTVILMQKHAKNPSIYSTYYLLLLRPLPTFSEAVQEIKSWAFPTSLCYKHVHSLDSLKYELTSKYKLW